MSPRLMLSLWRERWGKAGDSASRRPYLLGGINRWSDRLMDAQVWSLPGALKVACLLGVFVVAVVVTVELSLNSQMVFGVLVAAASLYARRYGGPWVAWTLVGVSLVASVRYFFWRFDATLSPYLDLALVLGFALCAAELHLWALKVVDLLAGAFPLKRGPVPLPAATDDWPTVDVFVPCHGLSDAGIERAARAVQALDWPIDKIKRYLLDDRPTDNRQRLARSLGLIHRPAPATDDGKIGSINDTLSATQGDWMLILDGECTPDRHLLTGVAGWAVADATLGMMQTAGHFLAPPPSQRILTVLKTPEPGGAFALIRRSALTQVRDLISEPVTAAAHPAIKLQAMGWRSACVGLVASSTPVVGSDPLTQEIRLPARPTLDVFRVDQPFADRALHGRQCLCALQDRLQFYRLVPWLILFIAPLAYLLAGINPIQSSAELLLAYLWPHWLHGYLVQSRFEGTTRLTVLEELKELALGLCILWATALSVTRTECRRWLAFDQPEKKPSPEVFDPLIAWPYALVLLLTLMGFMSGTLQSLMSAQAHPDMLTLYWVWSGYNVLLLAAVWAVARESQHIRQQTRQQARQPVTLRLPTGHTTSCVTDNFPSPLLALEAPFPLAVVEGDRVNISMFRHHREFVFPARVLALHGPSCWVSIEETAQGSYQMLGAAILSRGPDWPKWLPGRDADQPFPPWVIQLVDRVRAAISGGKKRLGELSWWVLVGGWMQAWKK